MRDLKRKIEDEADPVRRNELFAMVTAREATYTELRQRITNTTMLLNIPIPPPDASCVNKAAFVSNVRGALRARLNPATDTVNNNAARDRDDPNIPMKLQPAIITSVLGLPAGTSMKRLKDGCFEVQNLGACGVFGIQCELCRTLNYFYYSIPDVVLFEKDIQVDIDSGMITYTSSSYIDKTYLICNNYKCRNNLEKHKIIGKK